MRLCAAPLAVSMAVFALVVDPPALRAQRVAPVGIAPNAARPPLALLPAPPYPAAAPQRPTKVPYLLAGALVGGALTAGAIYLYVRDTECICTPFIFAPVVVGGAGIGLLGGWIVYRVRRP